MSKNRMDQWIKSLLKNLFKKATNEAVKVIKEKTKKGDDAEFEKSH